MSSILLLFLISSASFIHTTLSVSDWTNECNKCSCMWVSGKRAANCSNKGFSVIPIDLSTEMSHIDFSNNPLHILRNNEFLITGLINIQKLKLQNCSLETLNEGAFKKLDLLYDLDLSRNSISKLGKNTFKETIKLRSLILSYNKIGFIEDGLFSDMAFIQRIYLDHNEIEYINENSFYNLPRLNDISFGYNNLKTIGFDLKQRLPKLYSLNVEENKWICDCHLELFRQSAITGNLLTHETKCMGPPKLQGKSWTDPGTFVCPPVIIDPPASTQIETKSNNITLTCKVSGEPEPDVDWTYNGYVSKQKYFISKSKYGEYMWNNLTITNLSHEDRGEYKCIAKNSSGEDEKNITLVVNSDVSS